MAASSSAAVTTSSTPGAALAAVDVEAGDPRVRGRRAQHVAIGLPGQVDIVGVAALAGDEPLVLDPAHRLPDPELAHLVPPIRADAAGGVRIHRRRLRLHTSARRSGDKPRARAAALRRAVATLAGSAAAGHDDADRLGEHDAGMGRPRVRGAGAGPAAAAGRPWPSAPPCRKWPASPAASCCWPATAPSRPAGIAAAADLLVGAGRRQRQGRLRRRRPGRVPSQRLSVVLQPVRPGGILLHPRRPDHPLPRRLAARLRRERRARILLVSRHPSAAPVAVTFPTSLPAEPCYSDGCRNRLQGRWMSRLACILGAVAGSTLAHGAQAAPGFGSSPSGASFDINTIGRAQRGPPLITSTGQGLPSSSISRRSTAMKPQRS